ncbi:MAG TPA: AmmeMemoRadiSam system protein B [Thermoplasmata archaeon]|nr:AmmeMemoRadiSam system protein B [Thermoplasmata archaeon]
MSPSPVRAPAVAGQFYPADGAELARAVETCFLDPRGPGALPPRQRAPGRTLRAAVVPHAGYEFSGAIAALAYSLVAAQRPPATVLVLGVDHYRLGAGPCLSNRDWLTPLGPTASDHDLVRALDRPPLRIDERAHAREHSIEVQLPFLEYVLPQPRFVALQVRFAPFDDLLETARVLRDAIDGRDVLVLASTDLSHYVPARTAERLDRLAIDAILARDPRLLYDTVERNDISMCGIAPTTVLLAALADEPLEARLLRWGHSGEAQPMREVVGYAAVALESARPRSPSVK